MPAPEDQPESETVSEVEITETLIKAGQSAKGGWSKEQLELIGVRWPPESGWKYRVIGKMLPMKKALSFISLGGFDSVETGRIDGSAKPVKP